MNIGFTDQWKDTPLNIGGQTKQTSIAWLMDILSPYIHYPLDGSVSKEKLIDQAKQMEKQQIELAWANGFISGFDIEKYGDNIKDPEQYYKETYGD